MDYILSYKNPNQHYLDIDLIISSVDSEILLVNLPVWRPGRYEEGNFAKNIKGFTVKDKSGRTLSFRKIQNHQWEVVTDGEKEVHIHYSYYCGKLDAGSCWLDETQLYVNPIHCFMFAEGYENNPVNVKVNLSTDYQIACSLEVKEGNILYAADYHTVVDSPFIASANIKHNSFISNGIVFHVWIQGECNPEWERILADLKAFTDEEINLFGTFPVKEYHFLYQILPDEFYHGVEHLSSTVIALGPGYSLNNKIYDEFIGISSHELFHAWNVKTIRPIEMMPYDYTRKNYSRLGFVYEGITTYYGNLILFRSKVFNGDQYVKTLNERIQKHLHNYGRFNQSVGDASFDTWIDGYVDGVPHRKTNIYNEGCIIALLLDLNIRMYTGDKKSLDDVMRILYIEASKKDYKGYSESDLQATVESVSGCSFQNFFDSFVYGTQDTQPLLEEALNYIGCQLSIQSSKHIYEHSFGFKLDNDQQKAVVKIIAPDSPAASAGLSIEDEIIAVNGWKVENNFDALCNEYLKDSITLSLFSKNKIKNIILNVSDKKFYSKYAVQRNQSATEQQLTAFNNWAKK